MKIASILYFSGTGNTWWASNQLSKELNKRGFNSKIYSIEAQNPTMLDLIKSSDLIFLNYPVYGSDRPEIVKEFISALPVIDEDFDKVVMGIICTQMMFSGDGAWLEHDQIESKGYRINWAVHLKMPNNISIPGFPLSYSNDRVKIDRIKKAQLKLENLADAILKGEKLRQGTSKISEILGQTQRKPYRKMITELQNDLSIDPFTCTKCGKCIRLCPVDNIKFADENLGAFPEFQGHCNLCLRCYNFCPSQSVLYRGRKFKPRRGTKALPYSGPTADFNPFLLKESI